MNKRLLSNILKITLLSIIIFFTLFASGNYIEMYPFILLGILPISSYVMNKFVKKDKKKFSIYNIITLVISIINIFFIGWLLAIYVDSFLLTEMLERTSGFNLFFSIVIIICLIIDIALNIKTYRNSVIIPVCIFIYLILLRYISYFCLDMYVYESSSYYINTNIFIITILLGLTLINGNIELKRMKLKKEA